MNSNPAAADRDDATRGAATLTFDAGREAERSGRFAEARRAYEDAVAALPQRADWHYRLGCVCLKLQDPVSAENSFRRALDLEPASASTLTNLGVSLDRQGRREEAVQAYRRSLQHGGTAVAHHNLGVDPRRGGAHRRGHPLLRGRHRPGPRRRGLPQPGPGARGPGRLMPAPWTASRRASAAIRRYALGHYHAALCLKMIGRYAEACRRFEQAWRLDARLARVPFHIGTCLHKLERYREARHSLERALEFFPEDGRVHFQLALTCDALGLPQEARGHYGRARALGPDNRIT